MGIKNKMAYISPVCVSQGGRELGREASKVLKVLVKTCRFAVATPPGMS